MAGAPAPLFVQLSLFPEERGLGRLEFKLQSHFQSRKRSGGGECEVRALDRERDVYSVQFLSEEGNWRLQRPRRGGVQLLGSKHLGMAFPCSKVGINV